jgi:hypothetical protein
MFRDIIAFLAKTFALVEITFLFFSKERLHFYKFGTLELLFSSPIWVLIEKIGINQGKQLYAIYVANFFIGFQKYTSKLINNIFYIIFSKC